MIDVSADEGWLTTVLRIMLLVQMLIQARWIHDCPLLTLPGIEKSHLSLFRAPDGSSGCIDCLPELAEVVRHDERYLHRVLNGNFPTRDIEQVKDVLSFLPAVEVKLVIRGVWEGRARQQDRRVVVSTGRFGQENWVKVHADQEYVVRIELNRIVTGKKVSDYSDNFLHLHWA